MEQVDFNLDLTTFDLTGFSLDTSEVSSFIAGLFANKRVDGVGGIWYDIGGSEVWYYIAQERKGANPSEIEAAIGKYCDKHLETSKYKKIDFTLTETNNGWRIDFKFDDGDTIIKRNVEI